MTRELNRKRQKLKKLIIFQLFRFTIHEHGIYDLPAGLKKCLAVTGKIDSSIYEINFSFVSLGLNRTGNV